MQIQPQNTTNFRALHVKGIPVENFSQIRKIVSETAPGVEHLYRAPKKGSAVFNAQIATEQFSDEETTMANKIKDLLSAPKSLAVFEAEQAAQKATPNIPIRKAPAYEIASVRNLEVLA